jgi:hypothetical protein
VLRRLILYGVVALLAVAVLAAGVLYWFLSGDGVRRALERQATAWLGQPVRIGTANASLMPRIALSVGDVQVGDPVRLTLPRVELSTELRALLSRRIEEADVTVSGGRVEMPLPFGLPDAAGAAGGAAAAPAAALAGGMQLVSVRTIALRDLVIASRGREITVSADSSLSGNRLTVRRFAVAQRETVLTAQGTVDLAPRVSATLQATANQLDFDDLLALAAAFTAAGAPGPARGAPAQINASIASPSARLAGVPVTRFEASILADGPDVRIEPLKFDLFGGRFDGWLDVGFGDMLDVRLGAGLSNLDVAQLAAFGGAPGAITGRLYGSGRFGARGPAFADVVGGMRGAGEATISAGSIARLNVVQTAVNFLAGRPPADSTGAGERFESISAGFALSDRIVRSDDLTLRAPDFDIFARGTLALPTKALDARANLVLSERLSAQTGRDLYRLTRAGNRVVLPALIGGTLGAPRLGIDASAVARRGLQNEIERRLQDLLERVKPPL